MNLDDWLYDAVDLLAHEYGWAKEKIYNDVYFDELYFLSRKINKRQMREWRMQLAIVQNPHTKNPKELWETLNREERLQQTDSKQGIERLRAFFANHPKFQVKDKK